MRALVAAFFVLHGLIHLLGVAKAFGLAQLPQLTRPISPGLGVLWLTAAVLFVAAAAAIFLWPRWWWAIGALAVVCSLAAIVPSWANAKFGAAANVLAVIAILFGFLAWGPLSLRAQYEDDVRRGLARAQPMPAITAADLAHLPAPVRRYLEMAGVVGHPRVRNFRARMHGRIRTTPETQWMSLSIVQVSFFDEPSRHFYMTASMFGVPVQGYHRYVGPQATMLVKAAAVVPVARQAGPEMDQAETVTFFNDMCLFAPATLIDPSIRWEPIDDRTARAVFTNAGHTISARLEFNDAGELVNFWSDDRWQALPSGELRALRWSTPFGHYRSFGPFRLGSRGEARWHEEGRDYAYIELEVDEIEYNVQ